MWNMVEYTSGPENRNAVESRESGRVRRIWQPSIRYSVTYSVICNATTKYDERTIFIFT